jgi:hypothetical protein
MAEQRGDAQDKGKKQFLEMINERSDKAHLQRLEITLPILDPRDWQGKPIPEREWFVSGIIPQRTVTNLSGDGG